MKKIFTILIIGAIIMTNTNAQDLSKLTPWKDRYSWLGPQEDLEISVLNNSRLYVRTYEKDAVPDGGHLPDEVHIDFGDVISHKIVAISEAKYLVEMAKKNNYYYYTNTPPFIHNEDFTFDSEHKEYIIIGKESVIYVITNKEPELIHEYGITVLPRRIYDEYADGTTDLKIEYRYEEKKNKEL